MSKLLIVNADDFGLTKGINQGVIKAFREGIVRSASIMAVGRAYDHAVRLTKENPRLDIGIHLCLIEEKPILAKEEISSLVGKDGYFLHNPREFIFSYLLGRIKLVQIEKEFDAQIRKVLDSRLKITHIDSHSYIHILPSVLRIVIGLAKKYGILFIRYPYERLINFHAGRLSRQFIRCILNMLCLASRQNFKDKGILTADYFYGFLNSGRLSGAYLEQILKDTREGVTEIICHPGVYSQDTQRYSHWQYLWPEELDILISGNIKKIIEEKKMELTSFRECHEA